MADLLAAGLLTAGFDTRRSFELRDAGHEGIRTRPAELAALLRPEDFVHLHTSADWNVCLDALMHVSGRVLMTLHDSKVLGGGCADPQGCDGCISGCDTVAGMGRCPQGIARAADIQAGHIRRIKALRPVVVAPSHWLLGIARQTFADSGLDFHCVPNGVDAPAEAGENVREIARRKWGIAPSAKLVVFSAHGGERAALKGGAHWRDIWQAVKAAHPDAVGVMAGGDAHGRDGDLIRAPYMEAGELFTLLRAADIFLYPSLADNHPLAVLEAMAAATPVLAFAVGGIPEQVEQRRSGWLVPKGKWDVFAKSAVHLLGDAETLRMAGRMGHATWKERFTVAHMVGGYAALYAELARRTRL